MKRRIFIGNALRFAAAGILFLSGAAQAQRGGSGGRTGGRSNATRSGAARSGSTRQSSSRDRSQHSRKQQSKKKTSTQRRASGRRASTRNRKRSPNYRSRRRTRRVSRSRRYRRRRWRHHRYWRHWSWYRGRWVGLVFITVAVFAAASAPTTTYTYHSVTYYHVNPWYRKVLYEGQEGYAQTTVPVGHRIGDLPEGAEKITVDDETYFYSEGSFFKEVSGGFEAVAPPVGAEVSSVPEDAVRDTEGDVVLHQFDELVLSEDKNDSGKTIYRVEPQPPEETIDAIPSGSPSFVADEETYYYVDFNFYVEFEESGEQGYVNGEPEIGAQLDTLPDEAEELQEDGETYYQFDSVFFEEVEDEDGTTFYEVVGSPDGSDEALSN